MERDTKQEIIAAVEDFFERKEAKYTPFTERGVARASYGIQSKLNHVDVLFIASDDKLVVKAMLPLKAEEDERAKVGEFLMRANYGLKTGGFDYDYNDGEISYRVSLYCGDEEFAPPTFEQIEFALIINLMMVSKYGDALLKVMFGLAEPEDAINSVEED